jgi:thioesterase domain-containing protein
MAGWIDPAGDQLVVLDERGRGAPVFCMHPIGGHANAYAGMVDLLAGDSPLYAIRSRARLAPALEHLSLAAMAESYASIVSRVRPEGALRLFGWSMGALVAHEVARELERCHRVVELVAMVDPPSGPLPASPDDYRIAVSMAVQIFHPTPPAGASIRGALRALDPRDLAHAYDWAVDHALVPREAVSREAFDGAVGLFAIHRGLASSFEPGVVRAPLVVWGARGVDRNARDWARHTTGACTHELVAADHFSIMRPPHIDAIVADLRAFPS